MTTFPVPVPTPETRPFWEGAAQGRLRLQRCADCGLAIHYPRTHCPSCTSPRLGWFDASGRATLWSYIIVHRAEPPFDAETPFVLAAVELEEGPRMMTRVVGVLPEPENLRVDMPLQVRFLRRGEVHLPVFAPVEETEGARP